MKGEGRKGKGKGKLKIRGREGDSLGKNQLGNVK